MTIQKMMRTMKRRRMMMKMKKKKMTIQKRMKMRPLPFLLWLMVWASDSGRR